MSDAPPPMDVPREPPPPDDGPAGRGGVAPGGRVPPHSLEAEVSVLGAAMLSRAAASEVTELLTPDDFYRSAHATVFEAIQDLVAKGDAVDTITVLDWVVARGRVDEIGGPSAVAELTAAVPTAANAAHYARIVHDKALLRRLIEAGTAVTRMGYEATEDARASVDRAEAEIFKVAEHGTKTDYSVLKDLLNESFERIEKLASDNSEVTGLPTGFNDLDRLTAGLQPENLIILAARPAMGKCVVGATRVLLADGTTERIDDLVRAGHAGIGFPVLAVDAARRLVPVVPSEFHDNGVRPVLRLGTAAGRSLVATPNHPLLTPSGWRHLEDLAPGDLVATPALLPTPVAAGTAVARATAPAGAPSPVVPSGRRSSAASVPGGGVQGGATVLAEPGPAVADVGGGVEWDVVRHVERAGAERVYDLTVPGHHSFVADDLVVHNSSLSLNLAQYVTVSLKRPAILFSLEMSKIEIVNRMLSAEAGIDSSKIKTGRLEDSDWRRLGDALGRLSEAPLYIDDTASISMLEISAKCRRLKQRGGLDLVIVDYLQLMQSHRQIDSRQQEVSEISRGLKMLAKDLGVPVIALSQLSRQPESRVDKRPQLADLRESGCLTRGTRLFRADTGRPVTFGELLDQDLRDVPVWATDDQGRLAPGRLTHAFPSGTRPVFRVRMASGALVEATANHPFRTWDGWTALGDLEVGSRVAAARRLPEPVAPSRMDDDELVRLAGTLGCPGGPTRLPDAAFALPSQQVHVLVELLLARTRDDTILVGDEQLAQDLRLLLLRAGRTASVRRDATVGSWVVTPEPALVGTPVARTGGGPSAVDDLFWDRIVAIEPIGEQPVFDATVAGLHNFVAEGLVLHNSIEQDADIVGFIYRDEVYDEDTPDKGIAELIIAKHRNGATRTVRLAFLNHLTKFANLAPPGQRGGGPGDGQGPPMPPPPGGGSPL